MPADEETGQGVARAAPHLHPPKHARKQGQVRTKPSASDGQGSTKFAASHTARHFQAWPDIALAGNFSWRNRLFFIKKKDGRRNRMSGHLFPVFAESGFGAES
jgi:hypothetical protein